MERCLMQEWSYCVRALLFGNLCMTLCLKPHVEMRTSVLADACAHPASIIMHQAAYFWDALSVNADWSSPCALCSDLCRASDSCD